ncbi:hypothetical protein CDL12_12363 [Handroanthus impetiginosus]|uniref:Uncharacterized protein n=1 Tax=Handroanthus impetiginosus TaxID=429701 RepID=A0A2G9HBV7_9LAMI|nr:hypothetical protein CDL12_12363 [Handroanthus impetiginosus]
MTERDDSDAKYSENQTEEEDNVRKVNCLRGRLLAERMASRNAREEADKLGKKLVELENQLKEEAKLRNRAEKKLKFLMKRLESMNISYVTDESQSSVSSKSSPRIEGLEESENVCENQESMENDKSPKRSQNSEQNDPQLSLLSPSSSFEVNFAEMGSHENTISSKVSEIFEQNVQENAAVEDSLTSAGESHSGKTSQQNYNDSAIDEQRDFAYHGSESCTEEGLKRENDEEDHQNLMDNWMALVPVDIPKKNQSIDPEVLDATVKEVLDALRLAKEQLQSSMERRRMNMIRVG